MSLRFGNPKIVGVASERRGLLTTRQVAEAIQRDRFGDLRRNLTTEQRPVGL